MLWTVIHDSNKGADQCVASTPDTSNSGGGHVPYPVTSGAGRMSEGALAVYGGFGSGELRSTVFAFMSLTVGRSARVGAKNEEARST